MANACCIIAFDNQGTILCTLGVLQSEDIGQDIYCKLPNVGNREVDYILYTDKCGCCCCLSNENEVIIHTTQGEIKTLTASNGQNSTVIKWSEIFGLNRYKTMIRYKTGDYPTSISDGTLIIEELIQNQYSNNGYTKELPGGTTYYIRAFALDSNDNIISSKCTTTTPIAYQTTCWGYTGAEQTTVLQPGTYKIEVRGASGGNSNGGKGGYSQGCLTLTQATTLYIYVGQCGNTSNSSAFNGGGRGSSTGKGGGGGGGTDIRIGGNTLCHRRIVAGGGGGGDTSWVCYGGGVGGGCTGGNVANGKSSSAAGQGGTQTSGGIYISNGAAATGSGFGVGGYGSCSDSSSFAVVGGGGGRYGGGGGQANGGGGGSSYIYNSSTCGNTPSGYNHNTQYYIINGYTCDGSCSFPTAAGGVETGHSGNGCVKISLP